MGKHRILSQIVHEIYLILVFKSTAVIFNLIGDCLEMVSFMLLLFHMMSVSFDALILPPIFRFCFLLLIVVLSIYVRSLLYSFLQYGNTFQFASIYGLFVN